MMANSNSSSVPTLPQPSPISDSTSHVSIAQESTVCSSSTAAGCDGTGPQSVSVQFVASSESPQPQRFGISGRSRGKSISLSPGSTLLRVPRLSTNATTTTDSASAVSSLLNVPPSGIRPETPTPTPVSQLPVLPRSPVSPHRAKPRRGVSDELCPNTGHTTTLYDPEESSVDPICTAPAHADRGIHSHPTSADEPGTECCSTDGDSIKTESDNGVAETESVAGSTMTDAGSSAPSDSVSDCSNSDVEIYLETAGLDDSAMRMNCVGQNSFTDSSKRIGAESPVLPTSSQRLSIDVQVGLNAAIRQADQIKVERDDTQGWVTGSTQPPAHQQVRKRASSIILDGAIPPAVQHGESFKLSAGGLEDGNYDATLNALHSVDIKRHHGQGMGSSSSIDKAKLPSTQDQTRPRATSELKPTSADFKPRMAVELKPPLVEFRPSGTDFTTHATTSRNDPPSTRALLPTVRRPLPHQDADHSFQSNRAIPDHSFQVQDRGSCRQDDAVYLDQLEAPASHAFVEPDSSLQKSSADLEGTQDQLSFDDSHKTPNVYINGLPPHFPEDQLYALAAPFGEVKSVRTFTRHVRDSESGYGFVLFEDIPSAERCIIALRKYRNLHPTFSKQIHKIPGTIYAQSFSQAPSESMTSLSSWDSKRDDTDTFKRRMENLHDPTSTNLYMEGLPLSIDEPTLAALVSPHRISSSRFFQTRLSHPPRIIAFVRLETRVGAEDIIERLHGRMVRGWNDTGSRISVRFADTAEQRELRRSERATKEGDSAASRLTIAQAALLNLRGQEIRQAAKLSTLPVIGDRRRNPTPDYSYNEFSSSSIQLPAPQIARPVFEVDYNLAPGRSVPTQRIQSPGMLLPGHSQHYARQAPRSVDPSMAILLDNLRGNNPSFRGSGFSQYDNYSQQHSLALQNQAYMPEDYHTRAAPVQAKSGYTATEEFIMRAHADSRRRAVPAPLDLALQAKSRRESEFEAATANIGTGVRGYRTRAAAVNLDRKNPPSTLADIEPVSMMNEDEFHASVAQGHENHSPMAAMMSSGGEQDPDVTVRDSSSYNARGGQVVRQSARTFHTPVLPPQAQFKPSLATDLHHNQHVRSTTFPHRPAPSQHQRHHQHSSMSMPSTSQRTPQHAATAVMAQSPLLHDKQGYQGSLEKQNLRREVGNKLQAKLQHSSGVTSLHQNSYDTDNQPSPSLISPTLTYSSQTPSTLSPATPFFGSFNSQNDGFNQTGGLDGKKLRAGER